jgi:CRISPR-associated protein Cas2
MTPAVRERVWQVLEKWFEGGENDAILMTWVEHDQPGGQAVRTLGSPKKEVHDHHGVYLARRDLSPIELSTLT